MTFRRPKRNAFIKTNKYKNQIHEVDGIRFASKKEASRYGELKMLAKGGLIENLQIQVTFELQESFTNPMTNKKERPITYVADFVYFDKIADETIVEDVKASKFFMTDVFKLKRKMLLKQIADGKRKLRFVEIY